MTRKTQMPQSKARNAYQLLSEVRALILAEPKRYAQGVFILRGRGADFPSCGTVGCIAGWIATLKGPKHFTYKQTRSIAQRILGHDVGIDDLFDGGALGNIDDRTPEAARAGARLIRAFQKANAAQLKAKKV